MCNKGGHSVNIMLVSRAGTQGSRYKAGRSCCIGWWTFGV